MSLVEGDPEYVLRNPELDEKIRKHRKILLIAIPIEIFALTTFLILLANNESLYDICLEINDTNNRSDFSSFRTFCTWFLAIINIIVLTIGFCGVINMSFSTIAYMNAAYFLAFIYFIGSLFALTRPILIIAFLLLAFEEIFMLICSCRMLMAMHKKMSDEEKDRMMRQQRNINSGVKAARVCCVIQ